MRTWKEQLASVGVFDDTIEHFGLYDAEWSVCYPCEYPPRISQDGEIIWDTIERYRTLPDKLKSNPNIPRFRNPITDNLPNGEMPLFYTANYRALRQSVADAGGVLYLFEGDKDTWTAYESGLRNVAGILSAGARIDERLALQFKDLGVKTIRYFADNDNAGWNLAERLADLMQKYSVDFNAYHVPYYVNGKPVKDTSDAWLAVNYNPAVFHNVLSNAKYLLLPSQKQVFASSGDYFVPALYDLIEQGLKIPTDSWGNSEWSVNVSCPKEKHEQDHEHPAFGWNRRLHIGRCFKCGSTFLAKDIADTLGINWRNYVSQTHANVVPPSINVQPIDETFQAKEVKPMVGQSLLDGYKVDTMLSDLPPQAFTFTMRDALDDYEKRLKGIQMSEYPPIINPMGVLHKLGGLAHILTRPVMVGILGYSGGFKCVSGDTRIPTKNGYLPIETFANGQSGFSEFGLELLTPDGTKVASHFYDSGVAPTKKVVTRFGYELQGTYNHPIMMLDETGKLVWKRLDELMVGDYIAIERSQSLFGNKSDLPVLPMNYPTNRYKKNGDPIHLKYKDLPLPSILDEETAYVMGLLVGDGCLTRTTTIGFSTKDAELLDSLQNWLDRFGLKAVYRSGCDYIVNSVALLDWLKLCGVSGYSYEKKVPESIWKAPKEQVRAFLQGVFDTDGYAAHKDKFLISLSTSSPELSRGIHLLLLQFGIVARRQYVKNESHGDYRLTLRGIEAKRFFDLIGFRLGRKQDVSKYAPSKFNTNIDVIPHVPNLDLGRLSGKRGEEGKLRRHLNNALYNRKYGPTYTFLDQYRDVYPELNDLLDHGFFYDKVVSVEDAGEVHCYDVSVPDGHAFISNGFVSHNTSSVSSIMNRFSLQGYHGIVFSPEWSKQRHADRAVQQFGGLKMPEVSLSERYWYEKMQVDSGNMKFDDASLFGELPDEDRLDKTYRALNTMRRNLKGEIVYINKFGASVYDVLAMVIKTNHWMIENGMPPSYFIFDYAQLARAPKGVRDWTPDQTVTEIKALTVELGLATFVSSQVRKSDYAGIPDGKLLDSTSGKFVNDNEFNLFWTTNPTEGYVVRQDGSRIKEIKLSVTKNSDGNKADTPETAISIYADLNRMVILDRPDSGDPIMDIIQADEDAHPF